MKTENGHNQSAIFPQLNAASPFLVPVFRDKSRDFIAAFRPRRFSRLSGDSLDDLLDGPKSPKKIRIQTIQETSNLLEVISF